MTNAKKCLLANVCKLAGDPDKCTTSCSHFIQLHGRNGTGGRVAAANLPQEYRRLTLANSPCQNVNKRLSAYVKTFTREGEPIKSLYLWSQSPGTGKTTSAAALLNEWLIAHYIDSLKRGRQPLQRPAYFLDVNELQSRFNLATMANDDGELSRIADVVRTCQAVPFLVMDDVGVRSATEAFRAYIHAIINHRVSNGLVTIYTSNFALAEMKTIFDERLYDRMRHMTIELHFEGESQRGIRK